MQRHKQLQRRTPLSSGGLLTRKTRIGTKGKSDTAKIKESIQALLREIVILRDGGCILRHIAARYPHSYPACDSVLQADHLITRANSSTFADFRLVVCVCRAHHAWKSLGSNARKAEYDELIKTLIEPERVALLAACEANSWRPQRTYTSDWLKEEAYLRTKLQALRLEHAA
jgi:hypothetical protein